MHTALRELDLRFLSNWMEWDRTGCINFVLEPNEFCLAPKQKEVSQRELSCPVLGSPNLEQWCHEWRYTGMVCRCTHQNLYENENVYLLNVYENVQQALLKAKLFGQKFICPKIYVHICIYFYIYTHISSDGCTPYRHIAIRDFLAPD